MGTAAKASQRLYKETLRAGKKQRYILTVWKDWYGNVVKQERTENPDWDGTMAEEDLHYKDSSVLGVLGVVLLIIFFGGMAFKSWIMQ